MKRAPLDLTELFLAQARHSLEKHHLPRIEHCLRRLPERDIWWRPNPASNSAGNLALHLSGNVLQWIVSGLGGAPDVRRRDWEFAERGPIPRRKLLKLLRGTATLACKVLAELGPRELTGMRSIQGFRLTGFEAISHVTEHFAYHTGQIIFITKLRLGADLRFTRLPGERRRRKELSQV
ncbi:MAG TPA: DUF1572 family protein [Terriglobia bacterium]|nr:DUF1572 family protein [Terriglobia bacterium]